MSTTNPNPFASPASEPAPSVFNQFNASGLNMTPGQAGIASFRARGGVPLGGAQKMAAPPPQLSAASGLIANQGRLQAAQGLMQGQNGSAGNPTAALGGMYGGPAMTPPQGGPVPTAANGFQVTQNQRPPGWADRQLGNVTTPNAQPGQMPGRIRPPSAGFLRPRMAPGPQPVTSTY